ncbi:hypothetical protein [Prevotella veroralis]|nr:hypothetical protein [Prevotella veroralis]
MTKKDVETAITHALRNYHITTYDKDYCIVTPHAQTIQEEFIGPKVYTFQGTAEIKSEIGNNDILFNIRSIKGAAKITTSKTGEPVVEINSISLVK